MHPAQCVSPTRGRSVHSPIYAFALNSFRRSSRTDGSCTEVIPRSNPTQSRPRTQSQYHNADSAIFLLSANHDRLQARTISALVIISSHSSESASPLRMGTRPPLSARSRGVPTRVLIKLALRCYSKKLAEDGVSALIRSWEAGCRLARVKQRPRPRSVPTHTVEGAHLVDGTGVFVIGMLQHATGTKAR